jgi:hypothetical protein
VHAQFFCQNPLACPKIGTKFDAHSLFLSLIHHDNCHRSRTQLQINKLPTSTQLRVTWHTDSLDMVVLPTDALRYHSCCIGGGTSPEYFGYHLIVSSVYANKCGHFLTCFHNSEYLLGTLISGISCMFLVLSLWS